MYAPGSRIETTFHTNDPQTGVPVVPSGQVAAELVLSGVVDVATVTITPVDTGRYLAAVTIPDSAPAGVVEIVARYTIDGDQVERVVWRDQVAETAYHGEIELVTNDNPGNERDTYAVQWFEQGLPIEQAARIASPSIEGHEAVSGALAFSATPAVNALGVMTHVESANMLSPGDAWSITARATIDGRPAIWRALVSRDLPA